jgi:hypothetical protein
MSTADIYRIELMRAAFGEKWRETKVADLHRLNQYAERLAESERAQAILRAKGYGIAGTSFVELASSVPDHSPGILRSIFRSKAPDYRPRGDIFDIWTTR